MASKFYMAGEKNLISQPNDREEESRDTANRTWAQLTHRPTELRYYPASP